MTTAPTIVGIDLGKNWFHLIGIDARGATVLRKKLNRGQLAAFAVTAPAAINGLVRVRGTRILLHEYGRGTIRTGGGARSSSRRLRQPARPPSLDWVVRPQPTLFP